MGNVEVYFGHSKGKKQWDEMQWGSADNYTDYKESKIIPIIGAQKIFSSTININNDYYNLENNYNLPNMYNDKYKVYGTYWFSIYFCRN